MAKGKSSSKKTDLHQDLELNKLGERIKSLRMKRAIPAMNILHTSITSPGLNMAVMNRDRIFVCQH